MAVLGCTWLYWAVVGCTELCRAVVVYNGLYWAVRAVLGCTGLYWAVPGSPRDPGDSGGKGVPCVPGDLRGQVGRGD